MNITIGFSKPNKFKIGAKLISWWINKPYSHVFIRYTDSDGRDTVFQAAHGIVHVLSYENFLKNNISVIEYNTEATPDQYKQFRDFYFSKLGLPYDFSDLAKIFTNDLGLNLRIGNNSGYICSELASELLLTLGIKTHKEPYLMNPADVEKALLDRKA